MKFLLAALLAADAARPRPEFQCQTEAIAIAPQAMKAPSLCGELK